MRSHVYCVIKCLFPSYWKHCLYLLHIKLFTCVMFDAKSTSLLKHLRKMYTYAITLDLILFETADSIRKRYSK